jgi:hypothetical protein
VLHIDGLFNYTFIKTNKMAAKKLLSTVLKERTESIQYRAIRKELMNIAQNGKNVYLILRMDQYSQTRLQNEGITIEQINEGGWDKFRLSW